MTMVHSHALHIFFYGTAFSEFVATDLSQEVLRTSAAVLAEFGMRMKTVCDTSTEAWIGVRYCARSELASQRDGMQMLPTENLVNSCQGL